MEFDLSFLLQTTVPITGLIGWMILRLDRKFDKIENRFDKTEERIENRFDKIEERFEKTDQKFNSLLEEIKAIRKDISEINVRVGKMEQKNQDNFESEIKLILKEKTKG